MNNSTEVFTIIYDKIDYTKTLSPPFFHKIKVNDAFMKLQLLLMRMLAYGHANVKYMHYGSLGWIGTLVTLIILLDLV